MKERPILFSGEMVRAILDGRKTMTRRVIKPQPRLTPSGLWMRSGPCEERLLYGTIRHEDGSTDKIHEWHDSPYGQPGDRLWVRETFACLEPLARTPIIYAADRGPKDYRWRPSIHMPRWASRITLEIAAVRVERVQDITEKDVEAEGLSLQPWSGEGPAGWPKTAGFAQLWDSLNAKRGYGWDANPWVWVISFKRITAAQRRPR